MVPQSFSPSDLPVIGFLILLEGLLSADNALVLAIMVKHLKPAEQKKALFYGLAGAFVFRGVAILLASYIIRLWWLQAIGAAYLVFITFKHFLQHASTMEEAELKPGAGFWPTVAAVEVTDIAFAVDSVVAAVAIVRGVDKVWVVYAGAVIGVVLLRFAAGLFIRLLARFPALDHVAYVLVGWVGVKLAFMAGHNGVRSYNETSPQRLAFMVPEMPAAVFWSVMALIVVVGSWLAVKNAPAPEEPQPLPPDSP